jgi:IclR family transcriptional regulator, pca regulon regulatory protein
MATVGKATDPSDSAEPSVRRNGDFVRSLDRGLAVIRAFGPGKARMSLSDVARATGLTRAAARRFLLTLVSLGYVQSDGREFSLSPRVLSLGYAYLSGLTLPELAEPHMEDLVEQVEESSSIAVLDGDEIVDIARVPAKRITTVFAPVGTRFPAHASSKGRVLLAHLPAEELDRRLAELRIDPLTKHTVTDADRLREILTDVKAKGYAIVDQQLEEGLRSVAVPLRDAKGGVGASINVSAYTNRVTLERLREVILPALLETARKVELSLRSQVSRPPIDTSR